MGGQSRQPIMTLVNTTTRYGIVAQTFHWLIVVLVVLQFVLGITAHGLPVSLERLVLLARHKSIGFTIFGLVVLRLCWRLYSPAPPPAPVSLPVFRVAARLSHALLYALLLCMPLVGWLLSSASNLTVSWFGLFSLPNLVSPNRRLAHGLLLTHQSMAWLLLAVAILHIGAALWHHLILGDEVMLRMLPFTRRDRSQGKPP
ncbi:MAG TPA: cytochrome b [Gammaproteobacteria bacterium]|nr:cytochrome b [Gammaproteobacteria bacterium]